MKTKTTRLVFVTLLVFGIVFTSATQLALADSTEQIQLQDKSTNAMTNVIGLDLAQYKLTLIGNITDQPNIYGGLTRQTLTYTIESDKSSAQIVCTFIDKTLTRCYVYPIEGTLIYSKPLPENIVSATSELLQRYQAFSGNTFAQRASALLENVTDAKTLNVTSEDLKLQIANIDGAVDFTWWQVVKGVEFPSWLSVQFIDGQIKGFSDRSSFYQIGSANVNISREQAIQITKKLAEGHTTLNVSIGDGKYKQVVAAFTDDHMVTELQVANKEPTKMYPLWYVKIYFDKSYGGADGFQAGIWADTGEVAYSQVTGHHGAVLDADTADGSDTETAVLYTVVGVVVTVAIAVSALSLRKKRKK